MERRYTFIIFVGGRSYAAICDQYIKTDAELQAMKFGIWAAASKFKATASVYVYLRNASGNWMLCDSMNRKHDDNVVSQLSDDYIDLIGWYAKNKIYNNN